MKLPIEVLKVDHVAIATWDVTATVKLLTDVMGAEYFDGGDEHHNGFRWIQFTLPGGKFEVLEPLNREGFLYKFLQRRGEGMHHVTCYVKDLATAVEQLQAAGYEPVDINLQHEAWKEAFLSPRETAGFLLQLAQVPDINAPEHQPPKPLEEFLADRPNLRPD